MAKTDRKLNALHNQSAKQLRKFSASSAAAMQGEVAASMPAIMSAAANGGEAAGLRVLRAATQRARRRYERANGITAIQGTVRGVRAGVATHSQNAFALNVRAIKGSATAKAQALRKASAAPLGRAGAAWERELVSTATRWGAADSSALFSKLSRTVKQAARAGPTASRTTLATLARNGRKVVTSQAQISSRRAVNVAVDRVGALRSIEIRAKAKANGSNAYIWVTVGDDRVRDEHAERNGNKFKFSEPPEDGNPGEPPNCRCSAAVVVEL